jgi:hypothetical protein
VAAINFVRQLQSSFLGRTTFLSSGTLPKFRSPCLILSVFPAVDDYQFRGIVLLSVAVILLGLIAGLLRAFA